MRGRVRRNRSLCVGSSIFSICLVLFAPRPALSADMDSDGVDDAIDNCLFTVNPDQKDFDGDLWGDLCDFCPEDPSQACTVDDLDSDGLQRDRDPCATLAHSGVTPTDPPDQSPRSLTIIVKGIDKPAGSQGILLKGLFNPAPSGSDPAVTDPSVDTTLNPAMSGLSALLTVRASSGLLVDLLELEIPPGPVSTHCGKRDGWKEIHNGPKTIWKYKNASRAFPPDCVEDPSLPGVLVVLIKDLRSTKKNAYQFIIRANNTTHAADVAYPVELGRASLNTGLGAPGGGSPQAGWGQCAEGTFNSTLNLLPDPPFFEVIPVPERPPKPFCRRSPSTGTLRNVICKGL